MESWLQSNSFKMGRRWSVMSASAIGWNRAAMSVSYSRFRTLAYALSLGTGLLALAGCGVGTTGSTPTVVSGMGGRVMGGQQPITGSSVQLFAPGTTGYASASIPLLNRPVTSDANGNFSLTGTFTCPSSSTPVYIYVQGGNPGLAPGVNNSSIALMGLLGYCGDLTPSSYLVVNEMTTVAAVWAMAPFMVDATHIGTSSTNVQGLLNAVQTAGSLVSISSGQAPGNAPAIATIPVAEIHTLADILTSCVNSTGSTTPSSSCGRLFTAATPAGGIAPTDIVAASLDIARNPGHNASSIFNTVPSSPPFLPALTISPNDWTIGIQYSSPVLKTPTDLAIDSQGNAWVLSSGTSSTVSVLNSTGILGSYPQTGNNFQRMALDAYDDPWLTNATYSNVLELTNTGSHASSNPYTGGGLQGPGALAFDGVGNAWVSNSGPTLTKLNANGSALSPSTGYSTSGSGPGLAMAMDTSGSAWIVDSGADAIEVLGSSGQPIPGSPYTSGGLSGPFAIAIDTTGGAWIANRSGSSLSRISSSGDAIAGSPYSGGGLSAPIGLAMDGLANVWVVNSGSSSVSEFLSTGRAQSGGGGYGSASLTNPYRAAVDRSGSVWVANFGAVQAGYGDGDADRWGGCSGGDSAGAGGKE